MAFHEVRFPVDISWGSQGGPGYNTSVIVLGSGHEQRNINWSESRCEYDVGYGLKGTTQIETLISFFRARRGRAHGFRYKDWADYTCSSQESTQLTATSAGITQQIQKHYQSGTETISRDLEKICSGSTLIIWIDASTTKAYTIDYNTGIISITTTSTQTVNVTCEFDVPCRFDIDKLPLNISNYNRQKGYLGHTNIPVIEIKTTS